MRNTQETIADIIAEMRQGTRLPGYWRSCDLNKILMYHADRLEAALKRERLLSKSSENDNSAPVVSIDENKPGNAAAMHEALERCDAIAQLPETRELQSIKDMRNIIHAALSAPPRNCDLLGGDYKMLHTAWFDWTGSPSGQNPDGTAKMGFGEWLLAPIDARFVKCENLPRPATEAEVDSGVARWCAACAANCHNATKDILMKCKRFKEAKP